MEDRVVSRCAMHSGVRWKLDQRGQTHRHPTVKIKVSALHVLGVIFSCKNVRCYLYNQCCHRWENFIISNGQIHVQNTHILGPSHTWHHVIFSPPGSGVSWTWRCWPGCPAQSSLQTFWPQVWWLLVKDKITTIHKLSFTNNWEFTPQCSLQSGVKHAWKFSDL